MIYLLLVTIVSIGLLFWAAKVYGRKEQESDDKESARLMAEEKALSVYRAKRLADSVDLMHADDLERLRQELNSVK